MNYNLLNKHNIHEYLFYKYFKLELWKIESLIYFDVDNLPYYKSLIYNVHPNSLLYLKDTERDIWKKLYSHYLEDPTLIKLYKNTFEKLYNFNVEIDIDAINNMYKENAHIIKQYEEQ